MDISICVKEPFGFNPPDNSYSCPDDNEEPVTDDGLNRPRDLLREGKDIAGIWVNVFLLKWIHTSLSLLRHR